MVFFIQHLTKYKLLTNIKAALPSTLVLNVFYIFVTFIMCGHFAVNFDKSYIQNIHSFISMKVVWFDTFLFNHFFDRQRKKNELQFFVAPPSFAKIGKNKLFLFLFLLDLLGCNFLFRKGLFPTLFFFAQYNNVDVVVNVERKWTSSIRRSNQIFFHNNFKLKKKRKWLRNEDLS